MISTGTSWTWWRNRREGKVEKKTRINSVMVNIYSLDLLVNKQDSRAPGRGALNWRAQGLR